MAEQYRRAQSDGNAALILFIARYPDASQTDAARRTLKARPPETRAGAGPDADIILAFDQARLTPKTLAQFAARYHGHPLAAEASRPFWTGSTAP